MRKEPASFHPPLELSQYKLEKEDAYSHGRQLRFLLANYQKAMQSTSKNREVLMKCTMDDTVTIVKKLCNNLHTSPDVLLRKMGMSEISVHNVERIIKDDGVGGLLNLNLEDTLRELLRSVTSLLDTLLGEVGLILSDILSSVSGLLAGTLSSLVGPDGVLGGVLGKNGLLGGLLGGSSDPLGAVSSLSGSNSGPLGVVSGLTGSNSGPLGAVSGLTGGNKGPLGALPVLGGNNHGLLGG